MKKPKQDELRFFLLIMPNKYNQTFKIQQHTLQRVQTPRSSFTQLLQCIDPMVNSI